MQLSGKGLLAAFCLALAMTPPPAEASINDSYRCNLGSGAFAFVTTIPQERRGVYESIEGKAALDAVGNGIYTNDAASISFEAGRGPAKVWLGDVSFPCTITLADNETGGQTHATAAVGGSGQILNAVGQSLGGKLRDGPGMNFRQVGSVAEGTWLTILNNSGVRFNGYDWFEVALDNGRRGYQWGGIMCSNGQQLNGIYQKCGNPAAATPTNASASGGGWMAFAVGSNGRFGHGAASSQAEAERFALQYCGSSDCRIEDVTTARCHAMATAPGVHWFGAGATKKAARNFALGFCSNSGARGCRIEYAYCQ